MMRSSRHKSSKHGSMEGRDYLDSEKDYSVKKVREESGGSRKESVSRENRKMGLGSIEERDDFSGIVNVVDDDDEYGGSSSKKSKEMVDDDRWLGGEDEQEAIKNEGGSRSNKSRREWDAEMVESKGESKHRRPERKDKAEKEARVEERKGKGLAKSERSVNGEGSRNVKLDEDRAAKPLTGSDNQDDVRKSGYEKEHERRVRRKRDSVGDGDIHQDDIHVDDLRISSRDQFSKSGKRQDEISTKKYPEDLDKVNKHADEKLAEGRHPRDYAGTRSDDKYLRTENKKLEVQQKKLKSYYADSDGEKISQNRQHETDDRDHDPDHNRRHGRVRDDWDHEHEHEGDRDRGGDRDYERDRGGDRDYERDHGRDRDRDRDYERDCDRGRGRDRDYERDRGRDRDYERDRGRARDYKLDRGCDYEHESDRDRRQGYERHELDRDQGRNDRDHDLDRDHYKRERDRDPYDDDRDRGRGDHDHTSHLGSRSSSYKGDTRKRLSPECHDDHRNVQSRTEKFDDYYKEKHKSGKMTDKQDLKSRNAKVHEDRDGQRSLQCKGLSDDITGSNRGLPSPSSKSYSAVEKYRDATREDRKHYGSERDVMVASETHNEAPKYHPAEKRVKVNSSHSADLAMERTPPRKVSPNGFKNRSPSTSVDRRFVNRTGRRLSHDDDEVDRRSTGSNNVRDGSANEEALLKDLSSKEYLQSESSFRRRSAQGNASSHISAPLRRGADSPFLGSMGEESRGHTPSRYRGSVDPNIPRAHRKQWKGVPTWPSPLPNGFMPFPPGPIGPPADSFPGMIPPRFLPPPIFGLRPPMDMGHPGIPYISNADAFPMGPVRPFGWPNMVDASGPPFHGWDASNGVLRDGSSMFGPAHVPNGRSRDTNADIWTENGDVNMTDPGPGSLNFENKLKASVNEASSKTESQGSRGENDYAEDLGKSVTPKAVSGFEPSKEAPPAPTSLALEKSPETPAADNSANCLRQYLSKLDISAELADLELYNQCKSLEAKMLREIVDEYAELALLEESLVTGSEVSDPCYGVQLFPSVEDSIFQRALDLYNSQTNKSVPVISQLKNLHAPPLDMDGIEQILSLHNKTEKQLLPVDQEIEEHPVVAADSITQLASTTPDTEVHGAPSPTVDLDEDVSLKSVGLEMLDPASQIPTSTVPDITDAGIIDTLPCPVTTETIHPLLHGESSPGFSTIPNSVEDMNIIVKEGGGEDAHCSMDQVRGEVSGPLCLHNGSAGSEIVLESESVVLTRIHRPAESTH
ncbi:hypothetical protein AKJ16_DCAP21661 [Drosera capensis]